MRFLFSTVLCFTTFYCTAQYSIRGTVRDGKDNSVIVGATVYIPDLKKGSLTDLEGNFLIADLPKGRFLIQFQFLGYNNTVKHFNTGVDEHIAIILNNSAVATVYDRKASLKQDRVLLENGTETPTPSYTLWNAGFGFDLLNRKDIVLCSFHFTAENVFDAAYQNHLSRLKYADENPLTERRGVYNMGRNFSVKLLVPMIHKRKAQND